MAKLRSLVIFAFSVPLIFSGEALAQDSSVVSADADGIEELIVTARKKEERLLDIPSSITALTADRLNDLAISSIDDVARFAPGLSFSRAFGRSTERPVIRGAANILAGTAPLAESGAAYYLNGVYFQGDILSLDFNQVERVEVLKGPQSAAYGRNAYSGAINFVLKDLVGGEREVNLKATRGVAGKGNDRQEVSLTWRQPVNDNFGFMLSGRKWEYDGEYRNLVTGDTIGDEETESLMFGAQWQDGNHDARFYAIDTQDNDGTRALQLQRSDNNNCYPGFRSNLVKAAPTDPAARGTEVEANNPQNPYQYYCGVVRPLPYVRLNDGPTRSPAEGTDPNDTDAALPFSGVERDRQVFIAQYSYEHDSGWRLDVNMGYRKEDTMTGSDSDHWDLRRYFSTTDETEDRPVRSSFLSFMMLDQYEDNSLEVRFNSDPGKRWRWSVGYFEYDWKRRARAFDHRYAVTEYERIDVVTTEFRNNFDQITVINADESARLAEAIAAGRMVAPGITTACSETVITEHCVTEGTPSEVVRALGTGYSNTDKYEIHNTAFFGSLELDLTERSTLAIELRSASEEKLLRDTNTTPPRVTETELTAALAGTPTLRPHPSDSLLFIGLTIPVTRVFAVGGNEVVVEKNDRESFKSLTARVTYSFQPDPNSTLYASIASGNKPGGVNNADAGEQGFADFEEEESLAYELGFKSNLFDGALYMAGSAFYNDINKFQFTTPVAGTTLLSAVSNQGDAHIYGLEYELRAFVDPRMDIGFSIAATNPEINEGCDPFQYVLTSGGYEYDPDRTASEAQALGVRPGASCDVSGKQLPLTSKLQWAADVNWHIPLGTATLTFGVNGNFESSKFAQVHNGMETGDAFEVGAYVGVYSENWSLRLVGRNIGNEDAPVALTRWTDQGQGSSCFFTFSLDCAQVQSDEFTDGQNTYIQERPLFVAGAADFGSPRAPFISLRQQSSWVLTFEYNF